MKYKAMLFTSVIITKIVSCCSSKGSKETYKKQSDYTIPSGCARQDVV